MMEITPAPWNVFRHGLTHNNSYFVPPYYAIGGDGDVPVARTDNDANASLIAEAGNVYHETGLTPRQLMKQRGHLLELVERWVSRANCLKVNPNWYPEPIYQRFLIGTEEALAKIRKEGGAEGEER